MHTFEKFSNPPPYYSDFPGSLRVLQSRMTWAETSEGPRLFITGLLTNQGPMAWQKVEFETRFFNSNGQMIDAANGVSYFTIQATNDSAFRTSIKPMLSPNNYDSFKISVSAAHSTHGL